MFNPAEASQQIKREFIDYITTSDRFADHRMNDSFRKNLEEQISKGPIVDIKDSFESSVSIEDMIAEGVLSPAFRRLEAEKPARYGRKLPITRPLYAHQEQAIRSIVSGHSAIVTTGTGSGKTECFLIPILNELLKQAEAGSLPEGGVQAILLYPMNALANDQMKRLRELLLCYPKIRFGVYTGDTEETHSKALKRYRELRVNDPYDETRNDPIPNEIISREEMREQPPHILCTNYAMLEHLLLRPQDNSLFAESDIRFIVLDEAHVYHGATGIETAYLLRRLKARLVSARSTRFILTSATLGTQGESEKQILEFGERLTGETFEAEDIIYGRRVEQRFEKTMDIPIGFFEEIASRETDDADLSEEVLKTACARYDLPYHDEQKVSDNLFDLCYASRYYQDMRHGIRGPIELDRFAELLGLSTLQSIRFLHVLTQAFKNGVALVDVRYHFFMRALDGAYYSPGADDGMVWLTRRNSVNVNGVNYAAFEIAVCSDCGKTAIVGTEGQIDQNGIRHVEPVAMQDKDRARYWFFGNLDRGVEVEDEDLLDEEDDGQTKKKGRQKKSSPQFTAYRLCTLCGCIRKAEDGEPNCDCTGKKCITVYGYDASKRKCAYCGTGRMHRVFLPSHLATDVLGTSLFETLKPRRITERVDGVDRIREGGRQFLAFSDSRSEAAFFAPNLSQYYNDFLRRRGIANVAMEMKTLEEPDDHVTAADFADDLKNLFKRKNTFCESLAYDAATPAAKDKEAERHAWMAVLSTMLTMESRDSLTAFGFLQFRFRPHYSMEGGKDLISKFAEQYKTDRATMEGLLNHLIATVVKAGALTFRRMEEMKPEDIKYVFYSERVPELIEVKTKNSAGNQIGWLPRNREGKSDSYYTNSRMSLVMRALGCSEEDAIAFLRVYYAWLEGILNRHFRKADTGSSGRLPLELFDVLYPADPKAHWYRCNYCGRVTTYKWGDRCVSANCPGTLCEVDAEELRKNNHYVNLYSKPQLGPLLIREHTAQLSRSQGAKYQDDFEKNNIHALSCSTTFEMGVDVGDLETVFLRDVPPSAANYAQRAGRAGRSKHAAAYALTYAKLSSHDFTFFETPERLIDGTIQPPVFTLYNEKILNRHINAVVLAYLFHEDPGCYGSGKIKDFLDDKGDARLAKLLEERPEGLTKILRRTFESAGKDVEEYAASYDWTDCFTGEEGALTSMLGEYRGTLKAYAEELAQLKKQIDDGINAGNKHSAVMKQRDLYQKERLIDMLSRHNVLPRYGFPVDTAELTPLHTSQKTDEDSDKLKMQRDLRVAISEYAPGAKVIAGGDMYTARYVRKAFMGRDGKDDFHIGYICICSECGASNFDQVKKNTQLSCVQCGKLLSDEKAWHKSIEPREGFFTERKTEKVPRERPSHSYSNDAAYIGNGRQLEGYRYTVGDHTVKLVFSRKDKILITSKAPFYICERCGYGLSTTDTVRKKNGKTDDKTTKDLRDGIKPYIEAPHQNTRDIDCGGTLMRRRFHHIFETDVVGITFDRYSESDAMALSVTHALLRAMSEELDIEETEIDACVGPISAGILSVIFYDTAAGGAGHVHRLLDKDAFNRVLQKAMKIVSGCSCDSSCYSCLRSYRNRHFHEKLDRLLAEKYLGTFSGECTGWEQCTAPEQNEGPDEPEDEPVTAVQRPDTRIKTLQEGYPNDAPYRLIFEDLEDEVDEEDVDILRRLCEEAGSQESFPAPHGGMSMRLEPDGEAFSPLLFWPERKVMMTYKLDEETITALSADGWKVVPLDRDTSLQTLFE